MISGRRPEPWPFRCTGCGRPYPDDHASTPMPRLRRGLRLRGPLVYHSPPTPAPARRGIARFRATFPLSPSAPMISLGEGGTPLLPVQVGERVLHFKCEHLNPTGSYKDRGTAVLLSALSAAGVSRGGRGLRRATPGRRSPPTPPRAGMRARVFVPASASGSEAWRRSKPTGLRWWRSKARGPRRRRPCAGRPKAGRSTPATRTCRIGWRGWPPSPTSSSSSWAACRAP